MGQFLFPLSQAHLKAAAGDLDASRKVSESYARMCYMACTEREREIIAEGYLAGWLRGVYAGDRIRDYQVGRSDRDGWEARCADVAEQEGKRDGRVVEFFRLTNQYLVGIVLKFTR